MTHHFLEGVIVYLHNRIGKLHSISISWNSTRLGQFYGIKCDFKRTLDWSITWNYKNIFQTNKKSTMDSKKSKAIKIF